MLPLIFSSSLIRDLILPLNVNALFESYKGLDPSFERECKERVFLRHVLIELPDTLRLGCKQVIMLQKLHLLQEYIAVDKVHSVLLLYSRFLQVLVKPVQYLKDRVAVIKIIVKRYHRP